MAEAKLREGVVARDDDPLALDYLATFWTADSDYARLRALRGHTLSPRYLEENRNAARLHLSARLAGVRMSKLSVSLVERIVLDLSAAGLGNRRINAVLQSLRVATTYWSRIHRIASPLVGLEKLTETPKERGILTLEELAAIIALKDESPRVRAGILLGALCGLRRGEARGLQFDDIDTKVKRLTVRHNWVGDTEGLKAPKWGSTRTVPVPEPVLKAIELCGDVSPWGRQGFVLFNEKKPDRACCDTLLDLGFDRVLEKIGIDKQARQARNLVFHGTRHLFATLARSQGIDPMTVQALAGWKDSSMMDRYSSSGLIDFEDARRRIESSLGKAKRNKKAAGA